MRNKKLKNKIYSAKIVNTKDWKGHWFENMEGWEVEVKSYPWKSTFGGFTDYCNCTECLKARRGLKLYQTFEIVSGAKVGSIIPVVCLEFND